MSHLLLLGIVLAWAATIPILSSLTKSFSVENIIFLRFAISCIFLLPFAGKNKKNIVNGITMGAIGFLAYLFQTMGLDGGDTTNASLIIVLPVVVIPLISAIVWKMKIKISEWLSALLCFLGIAWSFGFSVGDFSIYDLYTTIAMLINSIYAIIIAKKSGEQVYSFAFWQTATCTALAALMIIFRQSDFTLELNWEIIFLSVLATLFPIVAQPIAQKKISATSTAIIFSLELVFALAFSFLYLGVVPNTNQIVGAALICSAFAASFRSNK